MRITGEYENETLLIRLEGKIDSATAHEAEEQLMGLRRAYPQGAVVLDAEQLQYISSSGLRVILKLRKLEKSLKMINVSSAVYEVLEITGFSELLDVRRALRTLDLQSGTVIGEGGHGKVIRLDGDTIVKLYHPGSPMEEAEREQEYAKKAFVMGIPTAIPFDVVRCGQQYGLVFELMNSDTLANRMMQEPQRLQEYAVKYAALLKELHSICVPEGALSDCRALYRSRIDGLSAYLTAQEVETLHRINDAIPEGDTVIHGDFHPGNIMLQDEELTLIDMADLTRGHPLYDLGSMALTHHVTRDARIAEITHMDAGMVRQLWNLFLTHYLETDDARVIELTVKKASVIALMKMASAITFSQGAVAPGVLEPLINMVRTNLLAHADQLIPLLTMDI